MFYQLTGWHCPGCGVSRMGLALLRGDFAMAWYSNPALMLLLPCGIWMGLRLLCRYVQTGSRQLHGWENWLLYGVIGLLLVFGVIRNLPWYPYL